MPSLIQRPLWRTPQREGLGVEFPCSRACRSPGAVPVSFSLDETRAALPPLRLAPGLGRIGSSHSPGQKGSWTGLPPLQGPSVALCLLKGT